MQMIAQKTALRRALTEIRKHLAAEGNHERDRRILENLSALEEYRRAALILCYCSTPLEVGTADIIRTAFSNGKAVALPCCDPATHTMHFYTFTDFSELSQSHYGIREPQKAESNLVRDFTGAVCIVPALSVDMNGHRLGYGGGYYDRFLEMHPTLFTVGLCYSDCLREALPVQIHDIPLRAVVTEQQSRYITGRENLEENNAG